MVNTVNMRRGFTLIELLIVIAILAILSTLGIGNFRSARIKASDINKKSDLQTIAKSLEAYVNDYRAYPRSNADGYIICKTGNVACRWGEPFTDDKGTIYAPKLPESDDESYWYTSNGSSYTISTHLDNTEDQSIIPEFDCGLKKCNYKITSSNIL